MERRDLPGLIQPYADNNISVVSSRPQCNDNLDPFSVYDDDSSTDHFFLVPPSKIDIQRFKHDFKALNNGIQSNDRLYQNTKTLTHPLMLKHKRIRYMPTNTKGEYCILSQDKSTLKTPYTPPWRPVNMNRDDLKKFAAKFSTSDYSNSEEKQININIIKDKNLERDYKTEKLIDYCTCMVCVKSVSLRFNSDDTGGNIDPCSCSGSPKRVLGKWLCLGILGLFLPCLLCYVPAKMCRKGCKENCPRAKLKADDVYEVRYVRDPFASSSATLL